MHSVKSDGNCGPASASQALKAKGLTYTPEQLRHLAATWIRGHSKDWDLIEFAQTKCDVPNKSRDDGNAISKWLEGEADIIRLSAGMRNPHNSESVVDGFVDVLFFYALSKALEMPFVLHFSNGKISLPDEADPNRQPRVDIIASKLDSNGEHRLIALTTDKSVHFEALVQAVRVVSGSPLLYMICDLGYFSAKRSPKQNPSLMFCFVFTKCISYMVQIGLGSNFLQMQKCPMQND